MLDDQSILFIDCVSDLYGSSRIARIIISFMQKAGYDVEALVAVEHNEPALRYAQQAELPILVMREFRSKPFKSLAKVVANSVHFAKLLRKCYPRHHIIYCNSFATLPAAIIARMMRRHCILHLHESAPTPVVALLLRATIRVFDLKIIVVSQAIKTAWGLANTPQAEVLHNGIPDLDEIHIENDRGRGADTKAATAILERGRKWDIAYVGRLTQKKGFYTFLNALRSLDSPERKGTKVLIIGGCLPGVSLPKGLFSDFSHLHIEYLGERADAATFFAQSKVACIPSLFADPFPTTGLEALRAGCLIIASKTGGLPEMLQETASILVEPDNAQELANALISMLADQQEGQSRQNRMQYESRFTLERFQQRFLTVFEQQSTTVPVLKIALLGTVGVPGRYGGFETLAENLVLYHARIRHRAILTVWCSSKESRDRAERFESARLRYIGLRANGIQSIPYDILSLLGAVFSGHNRIVLLGISGALALPLIRLISRARIVTNIDGIEWKREKWNGLARAFLKISEWAAIRFSHHIIADNQAIAHHIKEAYGSDSEIIAYGGDHAVAKMAASCRLPDGVPNTYALALCRIEPENNVHMILKAFASLDKPLVFVGNWKNTAYGRKLKAQYKDSENLYLLDPVYEPEGLYALRAKASAYIHGHSAGGTNPSLVEMMHFGIAILAFDCTFNRLTTENAAGYFKNSEELSALIYNLSPQKDVEIREAMLDIAQRRYRWDHIGKQYFELLDRI